MIVKMWLGTGEELVKYVNVQISISGKVSV